MIHPWKLQPPVVGTGGYPNWDPTYWVDIHERVLTQGDSPPRPIYAMNMQSAVLVPIPKIIYISVD